MTHVPSIISVFDPFRPLFTPPTWNKVQTLLQGTLLARGPRMVTTALRQMGREQEPDFARFHHVLNRAQWSPLSGARCLLEELIEVFAPQATLYLVLDETLERRSGEHIVQRGHYRDPLLSSRKRAVMSGAGRWMVLSGVVSVPWSTRPQALPFLGVPAPSPTVSQQRGRRHRTRGQLAQLLLRLVRRWQPDRELVLVGDTAYSIQTLGTWCQQHQAALLAPLRPDAALYAAAGPGRVRRARVVGARLPSPAQVAADPTTQWQALSLSWYQAGMRALEYACSDGIWYRGGKPPVPIRWVLVRDPHGRSPLKILLSTDTRLSAEQIITTFMLRWSTEPTFQESRAHLGLETPRQWSERAVERTTPLMLCLFSLLTWWGALSFPSGEVPIRQAAWYPKSQATFGDVLAALRQGLWREQLSLHSPVPHEGSILHHPVLARLLSAACY